MGKYILTCSCSGRDKKAAMEYEILFPGEPVPEIIKGRDRLMKFASQYDNGHLRALAKLGGKFAYYVNIDDNGNILEEYNLINGKRVG